MEKSNKIQKPTVFKDVLYFLPVRMRKLRAKNPDIKSAKKAKILE